MLVFGSVLGIFLLLFRREALIMRSGVGGGVGGGVSYTVIMT